MDENRRRKQGKILKGLLDDVESDLTRPNW